MFGYKKGHNFLSTTLYFLQNIVWLLLIVYFCRYVSAVNEMLFNNSYSSSTQSEDLARKVSVSSYFLERIIVLWQATIATIIQAI